MIKILRGLIVTLVTYGMLKFTFSITPLLDLVKLGLIILKIKMPPETFIFLIFAMIGINFLLSDSSLVAISSVPFILYFLVWIFQNSNIFGDLSILFTSIFSGKVSDLSILALLLLLAFSFVVDTYSRYVKIGVDWRELNLGILFSSFVILISFFASLLMIRLKEFHEGSIFLGVLLLLLLSFTFSMLEEEEEKETSTIIRVITKERSEVRVKEDIVEIIPEGGDEDLKIIEIKGKPREVYILEGDKRIKVPKVLEVLDSGKRVVLYSNEERIEV